MCAEPVVASRRWRLAATVFVVLLLVSRLAWLGVRLPHHDEMVHDSIASVLARHGAFEVRPAYHGPLLYHLQAATYRIAGHGMWQARLVPALAGIGAVLGLVALLRRQFGRREAAVAAALLLVSPSVLYYSRFDAHDTLILAATVLLAWSVQWWVEGRHARALLWGAIALGGAWATKLNALFLAGALVSFVATWRVWGGASITRTRPARGTWRLALDPLAFALVVVALLYFTTWLSLRGAHGTLDGVVVTAKRATIDPILYWAGQHQKQRLAGPFEYYTVMLAIYEPLLLCGAAALLVQAWRRAAWRWWLAADLLAGGAVLAALLLPVAARVQGTIRIHPWLLAFVPLVAVAGALAWRQAVADGDRARAWWIWMTATQMALYGFAGEKVPWLTVHMALPLSAVASIALVRWWDDASSSRSRLDLLVVAAIGGAMAVHGAVAVTTYHRSSSIEPIVQLEYGAETQRALQHVAAVCAHLPERPCLVTSREGRWLAEWYLSWHAARRVPHAVGLGNSRIPFAFEKPDEARQWMATTHAAQRLVLLDGTAWRQAFSRPSAGVILRFLVFRTPLGPPLISEHVLWTRKDLAGR